MNGWVWDGRNSEAKVVKSLAGWTFLSFSLSSILFFSWCFACAIDTHVFFFGVGPGRPSGDVPSPKFGSQQNPSFLTPRIPVETRKQLQADVYSAFLIQILFFLLLPS